MKTQKVNIHSQQYMETMARLMSEALGRAVTWDPAARAVRIKG